MESDKTFSWKTYQTGLAARILVFAFMGMGWDVLMTFTQQAIAGKLTIHALNIASVWMYLAYGGIPLLFYPVRAFTRKLRFPYALHIVTLLILFYCVEFSFGFSLKMTGIVPWDYNWNLASYWTFMGIITWHPVFLIAWSVFVIIVDCIDTTIIHSYDSLKENFLAYWKKL